MIHIKSKLCFVLVFLFSGIGHIEAQKLQRTDVPVELSSVAEKKGMYINTTLSKDGSLIQSFISYDLKKDELGFDVVMLDLNGKLMGVVSEKGNTDTGVKYGITIPPPNTVENPAKGLRVLRLVTANGMLGKLKAEEGNFEPKYRTSVDFGEYVTTYTPVLRGFKFASVKETESEMRLNIFAAHTAPGQNLEKKYTVLEGLIPNTVGYYNLNGAVAFIGKDARFDKNSPNAQNVLTTGLFDGKSRSFAGFNQTVMDYNLQKVSDGYDGKGNRAVLISTVNAPTTIAAHKKWNAGGKQYMSYLTFDTGSNIIENVTFESASVKGNFGIYGASDATFILGNIKGDHDGYFMPDVGKPTHFQIIKIQNNAVAAKVSTSLEDLQKLTVAQGGKKEKLDYGNLVFVKYEDLGNGDHLAFAQHPGGTVIFQFNADGKVNAVYPIGRVDGKELWATGVRILKNGKAMWVLLTEQSAAIAQGIKMSAERNAGSYMKDINFSRVDELMNFGKVLKLDPFSQTMSESIDITEEVILGDEPMFLGYNGQLIMPVRNLKSKKSYSMVIIN
jgi:hypothetical protein